MNDALTSAIDAVDLPALVAEMYPDSGARPGTAALVRASWRGDRKPSFSLYRARSGIWMFKDHSFGTEGNAFHFLRDIAKLKPHDAAVLLVERTGAKDLEPRSRKPKGGALGKPEEPALPQSPRVPLTQEQLDDIEFEKGYATGKLPYALKNRGIRDEDTTTYGIWEDNGDAVFRILDTNGVTVNYKRKIARPTNGMRYKYEVTGHGSTAWCNPGFGKAPRVLVVEGELNALVAHSVLAEAGQAVDVMGIAGANGAPYWDGLREKHVYVYADGDEPGTKAREAWLRTAKEAGARAAYALAPLRGKDFCDVAGEGRDRLLTELAERMRTAQASFTSLDSRVGFYTRGELMESAKRFISGDILTPTGYKELDRYTGGLPESGIVLVCALPSIGKSVMLRDILANHVDANPSAKVMLFSPDQSVPSVMRLLASKRSGIPAWRVRENRYTRGIIELHGTEKAARKHWQDVYTDTVLNYSRRFIVSEEHYLPDVKKAMLHAIEEEGVTLFGGDYLQTFELEAADGSEVEGKAIKDFRDWTRRNKVPIIFATQLAKYKFPQSRKSGIPYSSDIEGTGKIFQAAEMCFMLYNYDIYTQEAEEKEIDQPMSEYARVSAGQFVPLTRVYVRKNREGKRNDFMYLLWDREVPSFRNLEELEQVVSDPLPWSPKLMGGIGE